MGPVLLGVSREGATRRGTRRVLERVTACSGSIRDRRSAGFSRRSSTRPKPLRQADWRPPLAANLTTAFGFAVASNLINNLPVGLIGASGLHASVASGHLANAMLMGIDLGPNLSVTGSLATILWPAHAINQ